MSPKHCSDELLLLYLDGELDADRQRGVSDHLGACWTCRGRLGEIEKQIQELAAAADRNDFPGPGWVADSRRDFEIWKKTFESRFGPAPRIALTPRHRRSLVPPVAFAVVIFAFVAYLTMPREQKAGAAEVLAESQQLEDELYKKPVHQRFRVEFVQRWPELRRKEGKLEIWSEFHEGRFASRWRDGHGELKHALWRPGTSRSYVFNAARDATAARAADFPAKLVPLTQLGDHALSVEALDEAFARWLESRSWRPISFSSNLALFAGREGLTLQAKRLTDQSERSILQLSTSRLRAEGTVRMTVDLDAATLRPLAQRLEFENQQARVELMLTAEGTDAISLGEHWLQIFLPEVPVALTGPPPPKLRETLLPPPLAAYDLAPLRPPRPSEAELVTAEVDAFYALHRAGACRGEPVEVTRTPDDYVLIRGVADSAERTRRMLQTLAELEAQVWVKLEIRTLREAMEPAEASAPEGLPVTGLGTSLSFVAHELPVEEGLAAFLREQPLEPGEPDSVPERIARFAVKAVTSSEEALAEVWALRRLAEKFPVERVEALDSRSGWLLEVMLRDHATELSRQQHVLANRLQPALQSFVELLDKPTPVRQDVSRSASWQAEVESMFEIQQASHEGVLALFAGASLPSESIPDQDGRIRLSSPQETAKRLLTILPVARSQVRNVEQAVSERAAPQ